MFGLAIGVFLFEKDFQTAGETTDAGEYRMVKFPVTPLPYTTSWENSDDFTGLFQHEGQFYNVIHQKIENDTAYVTLKTNLSARERFSELADQISDTTRNASADSHPLRKAIRSLSNLVKVYWMSHHRPVLVFSNIASRVFTSYTDTQTTFISPLLALFTPPPES